MGYNQGELQMKDVSLVLDILDWTDSSVRRNSITLPLNYHTIHSPTPFVQHATVVLTGITF